LGVGVGGGVGVAVGVAGGECSAGGEVPSSSSAKSHSGEALSTATRLRLCDECCRSAPPLPSAGTPPAASVRPSAGQASAGRAMRRPGAGLSTTRRARSVRSGAMKSRNSRMAAACAPRRARSRSQPFPAPPEGWAGWVSGCGDGGWFAICMPVPGGLRLRPLPPERLARAVAARCCCCCCLSPPPPLWSWSWSEGAEAEAEEEMVEGEEEGAGAMRESSRSTISNPAGPSSLHPSSQLATRCAHAPGRRSEAAARTARG
jgi:hypothetical protein